MLFLTLNVLFFLVFYYIHDDVTPPWMTCKFTVTHFIIFFNVYI